MGEKAKSFWKRWKESVVFVMIACGILFVLSALLAFITPRIFRAVLLMLFVILVGAYNWYRIMICLLKVNPGLYHEYLRKGWNFDKSSLQVLLDVQTRYADIPFLKTVYVRMRFYQVLCWMQVILIPAVVLL